MQRIAELVQQVVNMPGTSFIPFIPFVQASKEEKLSICKEIIKKSLTEIHARCMVKKVRFDLETLLCDIFPSK